MVSAWVPNASLFCEGTVDVVHIVFGFVLSCSGGGRSSLM